MGNTFAAPAPAAIAEAKRSNIVKWNEFLSGIKFLVSASLKPMHVQRYKRNGDTITMSDVDIIMVADMESHFLCCCGYADNRMKTYCDFGRDGIIALFVTDDVEEFIHHMKGRSFIPKTGFYTGLTLTINSEDGLMWLDIKRSNLKLPAQAKFPHYDEQDL